MAADLERRVAAVIAKRTGEPARVARQRPVGGGCIHDARIFELDDGRRFFVKSNPRPLPGMFEREAEGLAALAAAGALRVPRVIGTGGGDDDGGAGDGGDGGDGGGEPFLVLEAIESGARGPRFSERFGRLFAELHRADSGHRGPGGEPFGFDRDNYLGATPQPNGWCHDWCDFQRRHRLGHQLELARRNGRSDRELDRLGDRLLDRLDHLLAEPEEPASLLHGDLWGGNYMVDEAGEPVLVDPAVYCGRREADLAMTHLFGGFDDRFYAAYEEAWPLAPGADRRLEAYKLYHLLNHLNLFGRSYRGGCVEILRRLV